LSLSKWADCVGRQRRRHLPDVPGGGGWLADPDRVPARPTSATQL